MFKINLTDGYSPVDHIPAPAIQHEKFVFPGGEPHFKLGRDAFFGVGDGPIDLWITTKLRSFDDLGMLIACVDAIKHCSACKRNGVKLKLVVPYFPGARQDRHLDGECFTAKIYADQINRLGFEAVHVLDPHSEVTPALVENCVPISNHRFILEVIEEIHDNTGEWPMLMAPDAGASKKMFALLQAVRAEFPSYRDKEYYQGEKHRDMQTGKLDGFSSNIRHMTSAPILIVDDICDGGGTFIGLARAVKTLATGKLYLAVTHGIFSKGMSELEQEFEFVYSTDSFCDAELSPNHVIIPQKLF